MPPANGTGRARICRHVLCRWAGVPPASNPRPPMRSRLHARSRLTSPRRVSRALTRPPPGAPSSSAVPPGSHSGSRCFTAVTAPGSPNFSHAVPFAPATGRPRGARTPCCRAHSGLPTPVFSLRLKKKFCRSGDCLSSPLCSADRQTPPRLRNPRLFLRCPQNRQVILFTAHF
jgi:hypothetical protein